MENKTILNIVFACIGTFLTYLFGGWDLALKILVSFMVIDYITGVIVAYINQEIDSRVGFKRICRKMLILIVLITSVLLDRLFGSEWTFRTATCYFYIGNEGISILENMGKCGIPLPDKLMDKLVQLKDEEGGNMNE